ncbi:glycosyltransferase family 2 protein [Prosthecobacter sp.]|uniref:glycosyltransferase family 2 protein n=1 Tax=Prosthecobacter sp. TaxID=1965333 RepID=UPI0037833677
MDLTHITPLIIVFNEEPNLRRTLQRLAWARDIVIIDSGSTDATLDIVREFPQVRVLERPFDTFARQCNFGLEQVRTEWVLSLDADYVLTDAWISEVTALQPGPEVMGLTAQFVYCVYGRPLRASLYPPRTVLYRRASGTYRDDGHGHRVSISGECRRLHAKILHDDRKPLSRWFVAQLKYADAEAQKLIAAMPQELNKADRIRRWVWCAPLLVPGYTLLGKRLILDGRAGLFYAFQRMLAELMLSLRLLELRITRMKSPPPNAQNSSRRTGHAGG